MGASIAQSCAPDTLDVTYRNPTRKERAGFIGRARANLRHLQAIASASAAGQRASEHIQLQGESALLMRCIGLTTSALADLSRLPRRSSLTLQHEPRLMALLTEAGWVPLGCPLGRNFVAFFRSHCFCAALTFEEAESLRTALIFTVLCEISSRVSESAHHHGVPLCIPELLTALRLLVLNLKLPETAFELLCYEQILVADPAGAFCNMDSPNKQAYRRAVSQMSRKTGCSPGHVAEIALRLSRERETLSEADAHIGHYLIGRGKHLLLSRCGAKSRSFLYRIAAQPYAVAKLTCSAEIGVWVLATVCFSASLGPSGLHLWWRIMLTVLFAGLAFTTATQLIGLFGSLASGANIVPRINIVPNSTLELQCVIAVPALLFNEEQIDKLFDNLERHFLAGKGSLCAVLTDFPDSKTPGSTASEDCLLAFATERVRSLNQKYRDVSSEPFVLLHRDREWCEQQGVWMGWERKRGKLIALMRLITGGVSEFTTQEGPVERLSSAPYLMILDEDSQLTHNCLAQLLGCLAHPLNTDEQSLRGLPQKRYAIAEPQSAVTAESAAAWRWPEFFLPPVADGQRSRIKAPGHSTQHGLFGEAVFTGKGLVHVATMFARLGSAMPANRILSHDIIEGGLGKTLFVQDALLLESAPSSYALMLKRQHRWIRGDWQNLWWLTAGRWCGRSSLLARVGFLARWHVWKNAMHSISDISLCLLLAAAMMLRLGTAFNLILAAYAALAFPSYVSLAINLGYAIFAKSPREVAKVLRDRLILIHRRVVLKCSLCLLNANLALDAIARTVWRVVARRKLLEWQSMTASEFSQARSTKAGVLRSATGFFTFGIFVIVCVVLTPSGKVLLAILLAWFCSPWIARHLTVQPGRTARRAG